jgi:hypothetical protein
VWAFSIHINICFGFGGFHFASASISPSTLGTFTLASISPLLLIPNLGIWVLMSTSISRS